MSCWKFSSSLCVVLQPLFLGLVIGVGSGCPAPDQPNTRYGILFVVIRLRARSDDLVVRGVVVPAPEALGVFIEDEVHVLLSFKKGQ